MELYIHYKELPDGLSLEDFVGELNEVLDDTGVVCGGEDFRLDLELEDEKVNPKYAQMAVKAYLQRAGFAPDTAIELAGVPVGIYE